MDETTRREALPGFECREMVELITTYLEGSLSPDDTFRFERHLSRCPNCTAYMRQMRFTVVTTGQLRESDLAPQQRDELLEVFRRWKAS